MEYIIKITLYYKVPAHAHMPLNERFCLFSDKLNEIRGANKALIGWGIIKSHRCGGIVFASSESERCRESE